MGGRQEGVPEWKKEGEEKVVEEEEEEERVEESCSLGSLKAACPAWELDPI